MWQQRRMRNRAPCWRRYCCRCCSCNCCLLLCVYVCECVQESMLDLIWFWFYRVFNVCCACTAFVSSAARIVSIEAQSARTMMQRHALSVLTKLPSPSLPPITSSSSSSTSFILSHSSSLSSFPSPRDISTHGYVHRTVIVIRKSILYKNPTIQIMNSLHERDQLTLQAC
jgi:hypothetical protein